MNTEEQRRRDAAREADRATKPMRVAMAAAKFSLVQAKADMRHMSAQANKLWNETYSKALKERETSPRDV
jgi:hypothetical protein